MKCWCFRSRSVDQKTRFRKIHEEFSDNVKKIKKKIEGKGQIAEKNVANEKSAKLEKARFDK